jgi:deoxyadenosine/deoxycytidine kinase
MPRPPFVAIGGVQGSGKTTLARGLASVLGWKYVPESRPAIQLLPDLFREPARWAFEAQTAFLVNKALQIKSAMMDGIGVVLDRTLHEDVYVFAEYFRRRGDIDDSGYSTYQALADHFFEETPLPDLVIVCECPLDIVRMRLSNRSSGYATLYPPNHVQEIHDLYKEWIAEYVDSDFYNLDSVRIDTRIKNNLERLANEIVEILSKQDPSWNQLELFSKPVEPKLVKPGLLSLVRVANEPRRVVIDPRRVRRKPAVMRYPSVYIAAPFTGHAEVAPSDELFEAPHGVLPVGAYRDFLLGIERGLRKLGFNCHLPHRDINAWGKRKLPPAKAMELCSHYVREADLFVGVLGRSHGSHYEYGLARGLGKPTLVIRVGDLAESFMASGVGGDGGDLHIASVESLGGVEKVFEGSETRQFLGRFFPLRGDTNS